MATATWKGQVVANTETFEEVEGNVYFPPESLDRAFFKESDTTSVCPWKGSASYYTLVVDGEENKDAAWYYPETKEKAAQQGAALSSVMIDLS